MQTFKQFLESVKRFAGMVSETPKAVYEEYVDEVVAQEAPEFVTVSLKGGNGYV